MSGASTADLPDGATPLSLDEAHRLFGLILDGAVPHDALSRLLIAMADRGETAEEIAGAAQAMRQRMLAISAPTNAIDVCGTGGDGSHSLNVSTAVAIVVAACGVPVAKHGNRAASSLAGGADTLEALGLNLARASETAEATLADLGIAFLFAQVHHPALAPLAPLRRALGRRTIFNLLGPLANPAGVKRQLIGVGSLNLIEAYAHALQDLGAERFMVVNGCLEKPKRNEVYRGNEPVLDELSISGPSIVLEFPSRYSQEHKPVGWERGISCGAIDPETADLPYHPPKSLKGGDAQYNAAALRRLLHGEAGAYRDAVLLNAAGALIVANAATGWPEGAAIAAEAIDSGRARDILARWIAY